MKKAYTLITLVALIATVGLLVSIASGGDHKAEKAPSFTLQDAHGNTHSLEEYKGKIVVLEWTNPDCPFVKRHYNAGSIPAIAEKYRGKGVVWLAVNTTHYMSVEDTKKWVGKHGVSYPVLLDSDGAVGRKYGAKTTPHIFVIDPEGYLAYQGAVDSDPSAKTDAPVKDDATIYVAQALDSLLAGESVATSQTKPYGCSVKYKK